MPLSRSRLLAVDGDVGAEISRGLVMQCAEDLEFAVLGPLEVRRGGRLVPVRGWREHAVLAMLLLAGGDVVTVDRLVEAVWDDGPPEGAVKAVRNCVSALRRRTAGAGGTVIPIESAPLGYRIRLENCRLDADDFRRQAGEARRLGAAGEAARAAAGFRAALALWRGPALAGTGGRIMQAAAARLDEQRMTVLEECLDLELALGRHRQVVGELQAIAHEYPLRERIAGQLMLALYRSGRQAEALDRYHGLAKRLAEDLGIDPGAEVTRLHEAILRQDSSLDLMADSEPPRAEPPASPLRPAQLPLDVPGFTGRGTELAYLHALIAPAGDPGPGTTVVISAIAGTAGIGKTALAVRFAHQVADRFPDGQLYVNLRGFDPSGSPVEAGDALRRFLTALGTVPEAIPADMEDQAALYRSLLAGKRVLVLLDNARDAGQVRPLLPGSPGCLVIVTSRSELTGLVAAEGARPLTLGVLTPDEAAELLANRLGQNRLDSAPGAAEILISLCSGLPLALAIVAARAAARPGLGLADLAADLLGAHSRLDALETGDPATSVRAVFSWSYQQLSEPAARMFRLAGLHPGPDITTHAAASLAAIPAPQAHHLLTELTRSHLLIEQAPGRFGFHDLLRSYAAGLASAPDTADDPRDALGRLFDQYLATAASAMDRLRPADAHRRPRIPPPAIPTAAQDDPQSALKWLDDERSCLVAVTAHAAAHGWPAHAVQLSATLSQYLQGAHHADGLAIHGHARDAARQLGDRDAEAEALRYLGVARCRLGENAEAAGCFEQALTLYERTGNRIGQAHALNALGVTHWHMGCHSAGIRRQEQALALFRQAGERFCQVTVLNNLGDGLVRLGRYQEATTYLQEALALARRVGNQEGEAYALNNLGQAAHGAGREAQAARHLRQAVVAFTVLGHRTGQAEALTNLGTVLASLGQPEEAAEHHRRALAVFRAASNRSEESVALNGLGEAARAAGRPAEAVTHHSAALSLALDTADREQQARAHVGLGRAYEALGQPALAREHFQHSVDLHTSLGYPAA